MITRLALSSYCHDHLPAIRTERSANGAWWRVGMAVGLGLLLLIL